MRIRAGPTRRTLAVMLTPMLLAGFSWHVAAGGSQARGVDRPATDTQSVVVFDGPSAHFGFSSALYQQVATPPGRLQRACVERETGSPQNPVVRIEIPLPALQAHLDHGWSLVGPAPCP
jgi:hypothetical protein